MRLLENIGFMIGSDIDFSILIMLAGEPIASELVEMPH